MRPSNAYGYNRIAALSWSALPSTSLGESADKGDRLLNAAATAVADAIKDGALRGER